VLVWLVVRRDVWIGRRLEGASQCVVGGWVCGVRGCRVDWV
jgi:hypothetical protein